MLIGLIVVVSLMVIGSLVFIFWDKIKIASEKKNFDKKVGAKVYQLALDNDFYCINQVALKIDTKIIHFDHILFTNKFIYCIGKKYLANPVSGKFDDNQWFEYQANGHIEHIKNPMIIPKVRVDYLRGALRASEDLFVSLVIINDSCLIDKVEDCPVNQKILNLKDFKDFVQKREKMDIPTIDPLQEETLVQNIYKRSVKTKQMENEGRN